VSHASHQSKSAPTSAERPETPGQITVLAVDHNPILLEGIAVLIQSQPDMKLVGTANNGAAAVDLYRQISPDVTLIDLELPHLTATTAIYNILSTERHARIIGLTTSELNHSAQEALAAGVMAIVAKDRLEEMLVPLIRHRVRL
jgi:DNA-binding NarL/FixJ family response regulator